MKSGAWPVSTYVVGSRQSEACQMFQRVQAVTPPDALMTGARFISVCGLPLEALTLPLTQLASPPICVAQSEVSADHGPSGFLDDVKYDCARKRPAVSRLEMVGLGRAAHE